MIYGQGGTTTGYNTHYVGTDGYFSMLLASTRPTNKLLALQKDVFDISKVTVIGSPTITSDGVLLSDKNADNCISIPSLLDVRGDTYKLEFIFKTPEQFTNSESYVLGSGGLEIYRWQPSSYQFYYRKQDGSAVKIGDLSVTTNTEYNVVFLIQNNIIKAGYKPVNSRDYTYFTKDLGTTGIQITNLIFLRGQNIGTIPLSSIKITTNGTIFSPTKPIYYLERRKPKVWNKGQFTIVGNPSISEDGVASGFSVGNNVDIPISITSNKFTIEGEFTFGSDLTTFQFCCDVYSPDISRYIISIRPISDNHLAVCYWNGTGTEVVFYNQTEVPRIANKSYKYKIEIDGTTAKSTINGITKTINNFVFSNVTRIILGSNYDNGGYFHGSINLKQFKIYTDNNLVFDGGAETYVYDPSKFELVGTPTITEDGIASGFSTNGSTTSYVLANFEAGQLTGKSWEIEGCFDITNTVSGYCDLFRFDSYTYFLIQKTEIETRIICKFRTGNNDDVVATQEKFCWVSDSQWNSIYIKLSFNIESGGYKIFVKQNKNDSWRQLAYNYVASDTEFIPTTANKELNVIYAYPTSKIRIANNYWGNPNSIDLKQFSITVDGKEVFTGAKENYYMLRR